ncbi:MAG: GAF domain-containing protein [Pseudonocardia sp.]|nr:GAF domain-containing protein [Pseudonocardia sp.]
MPARYEPLVRGAAVTAATAAWVISALVNNLQGFALAASLVGGAALTVAAVGLPMFAERRAVARAASAQQIAEDASARMQLVVDDALEPLVYLIGRISDQRRRGLARDHALQELQGQATVVVLAAAAEVLGAQRLRSCFFALRGSDALAPVAFHGRAEQPRTTFTRGSALGDFALDLLERREDLFCPDVQIGPPPGWQPGGHAYRTFLAVPVATEARAFGILTVDGLCVGDLTVDDLAAARVFARLLAVALNA